MPNWRKVVTSGSDATLNSLTVSNGITGSLYGTASWSVNALTASYVNPLNQNVIITGSLSQGLTNTVIGNYSHAEGRTTTASGDYSHAEGRDTLARGQYSHAEGQSTIASGSYSHAEGQNTIASGSYSHAEGRAAIALGDYSHAEGRSAISLGSYSHAEGQSTIALGDYSHTEGQNTIASGSHQHVSGRYNTHGDDTSLFIIGNGRNNANRSDVFRVTGSIVQITGSLNVTGSTTLNGTLNVDNKYYFINTLSELPPPVGNVIALADNATYLFTTTVDLLGNRLVCGQNTTLLGGSSENSRIKSTGLTTEPLISSSYSIPMRGLTIEADIALRLIASGSTQAIDWFGVNFTNCPTVGIIKDYSNVIWTDCAFLEAANCVFDGTIGTVGFVTCLFNGRSGQTTMTLSTTGSITRRFRPIYSSFITSAGETALSIPTSSIANAEGYILDTCNFSGGGTYLSGANTGSLKSLFVNNVGISNTTNVGHYYMINNTTNTTIGVPNVNVWVKAAGTTTIGIGNSPKWVASGNNRIGYSGSISQDFKFTAVGTVQSATANQVISVAVAKNGTVQAKSEVTVRTNTANQPYPFAIQDLVSITFGDFIEVFVRNTNSDAVRVGDLNVIIDKIGS